MNVGNHLSKAQAALLRRLFGNPDLAVHKDKASLDRCLFRDARLGIAEQNEALWLKSVIHNLGDDLLWDPGEDLEGRGKK